MLDANKMTEPELERMFKREVEKVDGLCYKFVSPGNAGVRIGQLYSQPV